KVIENKFILEGSVPLSSISFENSVGFLLQYNDCDDAPSMDRRKAWAKKQVLTFPHQPKWAIWADVRNCGRIIIEQGG
ncbi:MAG: CBM9 family sugar-binding protein, partial [Candidatus Omnitrophica bacterium]|nr:CBM9 family sugar-binding protein [Candidatus Omnitrophota bacterium]